MKIRTEFPREVRDVEHVWVTLGDGSRLSGRMWLPADADDRPVPAILYFNP